MSLKEGIDMKTARNKQWLFLFFLVCTHLWACGGGGHNDDTDINEMMMDDDGGGNSNSDSGITEGDGSQIGSHDGGSGQSTDGDGGTASTSDGGKSDGSVSNPGDGGGLDGSTNPIGNDGGGKDGSTNPIGNDGGGKDSSVSNPIGNDGGGDTGTPDASLLPGGVDSITFKNVLTAEDMKAKYGANSPVFASVSGGAVTSTQYQKAEVFPPPGKTAPKPNVTDFYDECGMADVINLETTGCLTFHYLVQSVCPQYGVTISVGFLSPAEPYSAKQAKDITFYGNVQTALLSCLSRYGFTISGPGNVALCRECMPEATWQTSRDVRLTATVVAP